MKMSAIITIITLLLHFNWNVAQVDSFPSSICVTWLLMEECIGGDRALTSTDVKFTYNYTVSGETRSRVGPVLTKNNEELKMYNLTYPDSSGGGGDTTRQAEYYFEQLEHGGGQCNCLNISINCATGNENSRVRLCGGSASVPRRRKVTWTPQNLITEEDTPELGKTSPIQLECSQPPFIQVSFGILLQYPGKLETNIDTMDEGVEFSFRSRPTLEEWVPVTFLHAGHNRSSMVQIGDLDAEFRIRGYRVEQKNIAEDWHNITISMCDYIFDDSVQFRWLQTSVLSRAFSEVWSLTDVEVRQVLSNSETVDLLQENGTSKLTTWHSAVRNGEVFSYCGSGKNFVFGVNNGSGNDSAVRSRALLTTSIKLRKTDLTITTTPLPVTEKPEFVEELENEVLASVMNSEELTEIYNSENTTVRASSLKSVAVKMEAKSVELVYLLDIIVRDSANEMLSNSTIENIVNTGNLILESSSSEQSQSALVVGTTLLLTLDQLLFNTAPRSVTFSTTNIVLQSMPIELSNSQTSVTVLNTSTLDDGPSISLTLPLDLLRSFANYSGLRIISSVYRNNASRFFTEGLNKSTIASSIVGLAIQCGPGSCPTKNLMSNVSIVFEHSDLVQNMLETNDSLEISCVFLDIPPREDLILAIGQWSERGCTRNTVLSSTSRTVCDCNHLTHFALLLSPRPPELEEPSVTLSLSIISYIGVTISVVAMSVTVILLVIITAVHKLREVVIIRNHVHIHLCVNLSIAQIIFVVGVDKTGPDEGIVPIHCQVIAVAIQYFFMVSFMWMLMEGVVLYLALVKIFVSQTKKYIFGFTVTSYGLPLLYMGLTLPLGLIFKSYGHNKACFLSTENYFILAFIAPVVIIFLVNICFFIMAAKVIWHQIKKRDINKNAKKVVGWLKSSLPLVVVLGLTWITGVAVVEVEALYPLAYIYTIMAAFQGLFIFLALVVFSKAMIQDIKKLGTSDKNKKQKLITSKATNTLDTKTRFGVKNPVSDSKSTALVIGNSESHFNSSGNFESEKN